MKDNIERKWKKSLIYFQCGKKVEEELTFEKFIEGLKANMEFSFIYNNYFIDYAFHFEKQKKIYEINILNQTSNEDFHYYFSDFDDMLKAKIIDSSTISEIWEFLEN